MYISLVNDAEDVAIGTTFHNRLDPAYQNTIGMFAAILPLRVKVADELSFRELIKRVLSAWKGSIQRQPGLISLQELTAVYQHSAGLFDVLVSYESRLPNEPPEWLYRESDLPHISLMIAFLDYPAAGLEMEFLYRTELFTDADIAMMVSAIEGILGQAVGRSGSEDRGAAGKLKGRSTPRSCATRPQDGGVSRHFERMLH